MSDKAPEIGMAKGIREVIPVPFQGTHGSFTRMTGTLRAPLGEDPLDRAIRIHEGAHAKWSPDPKKYPLRSRNPDVVGLFEDYRVEAMLPYKLQLGLKALHTKERAAVRKFIKTSPHWRTNGRARYTTIMAALAARMPKSTLLSYLDTPGEKEFVSKCWEWMTKAVCTWPCDLVPLLDTVRWVIAQMDEFYMPQRNFVQDPWAKCRKPKIKRGGNHWGNLRIKDPPKDAQAKIPLRRRSYDVGVRVHRMSRYCTDQRIFSLKGRQKAMAVLLDASGSMRLEEEDIVELLERAPASLIAYYCGDSGATTVRTGELVIASRDGKRMVGDLPKIGCDNLVDGPSLEWLAEQSIEPKYWISDLGVTGVYGGFSTGLTECKRICYQHRIRIVPTIERFFEVLDGKERFK